MRPGRRSARLPGALLVVGLLLVPGAARAWESTAKWSVNVVGYRINPANQDVTDDAARTAIRSAANAWTYQSKAAFRFRYDGASAVTNVNQDGTNVVLFRNENGPVPGALAVSYTWRTGSTIVESDIVVFDAAATFITGNTACVDEHYLENVLIHEFGHSLGLDHSDVAAATMFPTTSDCSKAWTTLAADDIDGVETLYPCSQSSQCNDARVCTEDVCQATLCERTTIPGCCTASSQCGDGNACTTDTCVDNECAHAAIAGCCTANNQCGDGNACTTDACTNHACTHTAIAGCCLDAGACDDGDACTDDACVDLACSHTPIPGCPAEPTDAGTNPGSDAGTHPGSDARPDGPDGSAGGDARPDAGATRAFGGHGCGCAAQPGGRGYPVLVWGLLLLGWLVRRRGRLPRA